MVDHPKHYLANTYECINVIEAWGLNFNLGNSIKYICRCNRKGSKKEDLKKAIWYLRRELESINSNSSIVSVSVSKRVE